MAATTTSKSKVSAAKAFIESSVESCGPGSGEEVQRRIAETAYYRAQQRGFTPGNELEDWLEAEKEVIQGRLM